MELLNSLRPALAALAAYLIGSLSFAVIVSRLMGLADPRTFGSQNPGATNVLRSGSKVAALLTLLLDAAKGLLAVWWVKSFGPAYGLAEGTMAMVGLSAFLGHLYPLFFRFAGGKGVATGLGVLLGFNAWLGLASLLIWLFMALLFRYSSLASISAALFAALLYLLGDGGLWIANRSVAAAVSVIALLLAYRHRDNINRLLTGTETKLGRRKLPAAAQPPAHVHHHGHTHATRHHSTHH